jgi:hypothetical protein
MLYSSPSRLRAPLFAAAALAAWAAPAIARQDPSPPPSGIVVHLFGPSGVTNKILPAGTGSGTTAAPSTGAILHQMFVTGDPDATPGQSRPKGRQGQ